jgi:serine/threonine-protein kinase PknG
VPGELAPKLALGVACELADDAAGAARWYEVVSRTDPGHTTATFGLARCLLAGGDRAAALAAFARVPDSSSSYVDAQVARITCLLTPADHPAVSDLRSAAAGLEALKLDAEQRARLTVDLVRSALELIERDETVPEQDTTLLGCRLTERDLRVGLERGYRSLARHASAAGERIRLVELANRVRPRTWT